MKNPPHPDAEQESALINQHAKIEVQPAPGKLTHMTKKQIEKAVKKMKVQGHERSSAVSASPTIPLLAPRPGETLNTVQGYHFSENELDMKNLKPKKSTRLALKKLAKGLRPKRSKKAIAKTFGQESSYIPDHDKLIDQIVREMESIYACYCRLDSCRRALSDEERSFLHDQLATFDLVFHPTRTEASKDLWNRLLAKGLITKTGKLGKPKGRPRTLGELGKEDEKTPFLGLGKLKAVVASWRKKPILSMSSVDLDRDRRMLEGLWEDERVYQLVTGEPDHPVAVRWREILEEAAKLAEKSKTEVRAGEPTISLADMMKNYGLKPTPKNLKAEMGRRLDARKQAVLDEFGWLHLADFDGQLAKWKKRGQVFSVLEPEGRMSKAQHRRLTRDDEVFLTFQFADGKPIKAVKKILEAFGPKKDPWKLALWFVSNNGWLPDQARPVDLLGTRPKAVVAAARSDAGGNGT